MSWLDDMMPHVVTWAAVSGLNSSGDRAYSAGVQLAARVEYVSGLTRDVDGEEVVISHRVALTRAVSQHDKITLPDGSVRLVRAVERASEMDGDDELVIAEVS
jgi:hypothetical protein